MTEKLSPDRFRLETAFYDDHVIHTTYDTYSTAVSTKWSEKKPIGSGAFGEVTLQENEKGQLRAVKKIALGAKRLGLYGELKVLSSLANHPGPFVLFFGWYENRDFAFLAMEYIEHGDLSQYLTRSEAKSNAREITRQLLDGLAVLHEERICHRDLKPQNILIASIEPISVRIADFGVSKDEKGTELRTQVGTLFYLAPELLGLIRRKKNSYTNIMDIWALGCIVHEILTLQTPFEYTSTAATNSPVLSTKSSGFTNTAPPQQLDMALFNNFCLGNIEFPKESLRLCQVSDSGIDFVENSIDITQSRLEDECFVECVGVSISNACKAAKLLVSHYQWEQAALLLEDAIKMMPIISLKNLEQSDRQYALSQLSRLVADAASVALQAGQGAAHAFRLLEFGQKTIASLVADYRDELLELRAANLNSFNSFNNFRARIDSLAESRKSYSGTGSQGRYSESFKRSQVMEEIRRTLSDVRQMAGCQEFLLPPPHEELMKEAEYGPIVIINVTRFRSDAIIVTSSAIKALALPRLLCEEAENWMGQTDRLTRGASRTLLKRSELMLELLFWLWDVAVEPVVCELQHNTIINDLHVWWVGMGILARAPFHAAGDHSTGSTQNTLSQFISSYIPTIKALSHARQMTFNLANNPNPRVLVATMPTTPGRRPLPSVMKEAEDIIDIVGNRGGLTTVLERPSVSEVSKQVCINDVIHLAGHGYHSDDNPLDSGLLLLDESRETTQILTVQDILRIGPGTARLAYISACASGLPALHNESVSFMGAFLPAGFSHVVGPLWGARDDICLQIERDFHSTLFVGKESGDEHRKVGKALHEAVKRQRDENPGQPLSWATFVHIGA